MLSRLDLSIKFQLPDLPSRTAIFHRYAKHLSEEERRSLSTISEGMSGRNIADVCKDAERRWAAKLIRKETSSQLPDV
jgi:ATP-dependent 26S proteasome regulatory subunit